MVGGSAGSPAFTPSAASPASISSNPVYCTACQPNRRAASTFSAMSSTNTHSALSHSANRWAYSKNRGSGLRAPASCDTTTASKWESSARNWSRYRA